ncbi:MAG: exo-alpha-sialidase [Ignavibacteria bacterium]|nr:exo-alpha-sialidase [Ignavibacteria bacterium]
MEKIFLIVLLLLIQNSLSMSQWQSEVRLTNTNTYSANSAISSSGNFVHVVWSDNRDGNNEIYSKRSSDEGSSWSADMRLTNNTFFSILPSVSASGSQVHVVWEDSRNGNPEIYYNRSDDNGTSWSADTRLTNNNNTSQNAHVSASGSNVNVIWRDTRSGTYELFYKSSTDGGTNWSADAQLTNHTAGLVSSPSVSSNGSNVHMAWSDDRGDGNYDIYYKRSTDVGNTWGADARLTDGPDISETPSISATSTDVHIVWLDLRNGSNEIYHKRSADNGITWGIDTRLTNGPLQSQTPSVFSISSAVHIVWKYGFTNNEIYYVRSIDNGVNWEASKQISNSIISAYSSGVTASGTVVHVAWTDARHGSSNHQIYYKRNPTGNPVGIQQISSEIPDQFLLSQNYPNPFNPVTAINYSISENSFVTLKIYDVSGIEVATLVSENQSTGTYSYQFSSASYQLSSGVYFYRLQTSGYTDTKKMILTK